MTRFKKLIRQRYRECYKDMRYIRQCLYEAGGRYENGDSDLIHAEKKVNFYRLLCIILRIKL